jgi:hypothetical protein
MLDEVKKPSKKQEVASPVPPTTSVVYDDYEQDFYAWTQRQAQLLAQKRFAELDYDNLREEIEDLGKNEKREIESRLIVLCSYLLKWIYQPDHRSSSWRGSIALARREIKRTIRKNPSLKRYPDDAFLDAYNDARFKAMAETNLEESNFPLAPPFTGEEALDDTFWPA